MKIILIGAPGAGKDTLANQLKLKYNYIILSPGEIYRSQAQEKTELGLYAKNKYWGKGNLCPDHITNKLVQNTLNNLPNHSNNIIFNGYPRSIKQAKYLKNIIQVDVIINLLVNEDTAIKRLLKRGRIDDTKKIIKQRFQQHNKKTKPICNFYKNNYWTVDATLPSQQIYFLVVNDILNII